MAKVTGMAKVNFDINLNIGRKNIDGILPNGNTFDARNGLMLVETPGSSMMSMAIYSFERELAMIQFNSGRVYLYYRVPFSTFWELACADSAGKYFNEHIRGEYQYDDVTAEIAIGLAYKCVKRNAAA